MTGYARPTPQAIISGLAAGDVRGRKSNTNKHLWPRATRPGPGIVDSLIKQFRQSSQLSGGNAGYIEDLYEQYLLDPDSVGPKW